MNTEADKKLRPRSPEFPFLPLGEAIEKTRLILAANQRHAARIGSLAVVLKTSRLSSAFLRTIGALKAFGLIDDAGSGDDRKISVSELGARLISDMRPGAREAAIQKAFETCSILNEFYGRWGNQRPSDPVCMSELTLDCKFGEDAAKKFIRVYDASVVFLESNVGAPQAEVSATVPDREPEAPAATTDKIVRWPKPAVEVSPKMGGNMTEATYPITEGICTFAYPSELSQRSASRLVKWLKLMLEDVEEIAKHPQPTNEEGNS
jgi:hypothetical protein